MGREATAVCHWKDQIAEVLLHLDGKHLSLRGTLRDDIPRDAIIDVVVVPEGLRVVTDGPELMLEFAKPDALRWQKALLKKPPTLAEKLGVSQEMPAYLLGQTDDDALRAALDGAQVTGVAEAAILVAVLMQESDLLAASDLAVMHPDKHIWMVHEKGKKAGVGDTKVRTHMRALGFVDSKTSAISARFTATRYRLRK